MATHSSVLAWRSPGTGEPGGLPSMGSHASGVSSLCGTTEPSAAESQGKCGISEDELITAIKEAKGLSYETTESPRPAGQRAERPEAKARSGLPTIPSPLDHEASSAESGDSEIELVSEDPLAAEDALPSGYVTFGHVGGPPPSPASPSIQYSLLREEREAELDSELIIESCDASSASEESPKREQDSPPMKPGALDAIREEPGARAEERTPSRRGLAPQPCTSGNKVFAIEHLDRLSHNKHQLSQADCKENGNLQGQVEAIRRVQMCPPKGPPDRMYPPSERGWNAAPFCVLSTDGTQHQQAVSKCLSSG